MTRDKDVGDLVELRKRAEQSVQRKIQGSKDISTLSREEAEQLIHDLEVQQVELEMQNEELRRVQEQLEESRDNYAALYDFSPVGYFTLDDNGVIRQVNLTGARLLRLERQYLVNAPFVVFVTPESRDDFCYHLKAIFESQTTQTCEIELERKDGITFHARVESLMQGGRAGESLACRTVISDITEQQKAQEEIQTLNRELKQKIDELTTTLETVRAQADLLMAIQRTQAQIICDPSAQYGNLLQNLLYLANSEFGFIDELRYTQDGRPYLKVDAMTDISWDKESRKRYKEFCDNRGLEVHNIRGLFGSVIHTGGAVISNNPPTDPRRIGLPKGHPPLRSFLGLPIHHESKIVGMLGMANRPGGYDQGVVNFLQPALATCASIIQANREAALRRETEMRLFETNRRLHALMDALPVGVSFSDDPSCQRITGNPRLFGQFEITPDDNVSASGPDPRAPGRLVRYFYEGRELKDTELPLQRAVAEKALISPIELEVHLPSGRSWFAETSGAPILDEKGDVLGGVAVTVDVTARKTAEQALRSSEKAYRTLAENIPGIVYRVHHDDGPTMEFFNDTVESITGFKKDELKFGRVCSIDPLILASDRSRVVELVEKACAANTPFEVEYRIQRKDGSIRHLVEHGRPILDTVGSPVLIDGVIFDITDRKRAEEELRRAHDKLEVRNLELESFSYSISHDLRAPLRSITGFSEIVARRHRDGLNQEVRRYVDNIITASHHMERLIEDLLAYSRVGRKGLRCQGVPLRSVMSQVLNDLSDPITQSSAEIIMPRKLPVVSGDSTLLFQIFVSLIDNALKYRRPKVKPKVNMSYKRDADYVVVQVADNGVGIPAECHEKVFNLFQRLHSQDQVPGTGIGLAIMRKAVRALEGQVWLESTVGKGTTFYVKLPLESGKGKESNLNRRK